MSETPKASAIPDSVRVAMLKAFLTYSKSKKKSHEILRLDNFEFLLTALDAATHEGERLRAIMDGCQQCTQQFVNRALDEARENVRPQVEQEEEAGRGPLPNIIFRGDI